MPHTIELSDASQYSSRTLTFVGGAVPTQMRWGHSPLQEQPLYLLLRYDVEGLAIQVKEAGSEEPWDSKNTRRINLIRKNVAKTITLDEKRDLEELQAEASGRLHKFASPRKDIEEFEARLRAKGIIIPN